MVEAAQDGDGKHATAYRRASCAIPGAHGDPLRQALMWPLVLEVPDALAEDAPQVPLSQDQDMIHALPPHAAEEALARGGLPGRAVGRPQLRDARGGGDAGERLTVVLAEKSIRTAESAPWREGRSWSRQARAAARDRGTLSSVSSERCA